MTSVQSTYTLGFALSSPFFSTPLSFAEPLHDSTTAAGRPPVMIYTVRFTGISGCISTKELCEVLMSRL